MFSLLLKDLISDFFFFWPGAISIIEQQYDKTYKMISVPSKDSDQVGYLTSLNVTVIFLQLAYRYKGLCYEMD